MSGDLIFAYSLPTTTPWCVKCELKAVLGTAKGHHGE